MADAPSGATGPDQLLPKPKSGSVAFLSTSTGRVVMAGVVLFIILVAVGAIAFFFLLNGAKPPQVTPTTSGGGVKSSTTTPVVAPTSPPETRLDETFTFRNIFAPSVSPPVAPSSTTTDTSGTGGSGVGAKDTLFLESITRDSGERVAKFSWNGTAYDVREGEQVDGSPWQVITLGSDSALMLFGDSKITLSVGQGFQGDASSK